MNFMNYVKAATTFYTMIVKHNPQFEPEILSVIIKTLDDKDDKIRLIAAKGLSHISYSNIDQTKQIYSIYKKKVLKDKSSDVRCIAIEALGQIGNSNPVMYKSIFSELKKNALKDKALNVRLKATEALGLMNFPSTL